MTEFLQEFIRQYSDMLGQDLSSYSLYGSASRPVQHVWARIPDAVYMQDPMRLTPYYTIIAVPAPLPEEIIEKFELSVIEEDRRPTVAQQDTTHYVW